MGIRVKIDNVESAALQALQRKGELQMAIHTFAFASRDPGGSAAARTIRRTHCDVVAHVDAKARKVYVIGGNVAQAVTANRDR